MKPSQIVYLKNISPKLTVENITADDKVVCSWMVGKTKKYCTLPFSCLSEKREES